MAIASLVMGLVWIYWIGSVLALVFGYVARNQIDREHGRLGGRGMATAGIVLGWVEIGILVPVIIALVLSLRS
jgi:ABC-type phosphate transport system permease subunit